MDVVDFYERYPYPRPVESLDEYRLRWQDRDRRRAEYHLHWPANAYREDHSILIAGCGTSQAAKHAMRWPAARVVGIDFSATSVDRTLQLKQRHGLDNLQVHQLAIERVEALQQRFDWIVCTGVLHHLPDPDAGLAALRRVLDRDGAMQLMLYAPYGRAGIYMLQEFCQRIGIRATDDEIHKLIAALTLLPRGHPLENLLRQAPDFRQEAALADALLHPQDRAYTVPQVFDFIARAGLTFGRWVRQAPYSAYCGAPARIPQADRLRQLSPAGQFAAIELFRGTMLRHSFIAYGNDHAGSPQPIGFDDDAWPDYVPIPVADTIRVEDDLPAGAAAALINRTHTYSDLVLPISAQEVGMLDAIDGRRSIAEIASDDANLGIARALFQRLWRYDQILFDASR
ncbi:class I SAM-dependent methyltransferase [Lysobacter sp. S4-A87]|uniref:class I SAM-dependent methyltransferase n=1 Tax=Lysobacter sp. S4-A87 TaxID=2925843 RepID=UPI001F536D99|nr:class I SAM-dependent methyltransferase [Lysobacter sp. S4-A87]UNK50582.1 class I SAM-dependent methyltransferase [Lysobacter sp. S4-A87]